MSTISKSMQGYVNFTFVSDLNVEGKLNTRLKKIS